MSTAWWHDQLLAALSCWFEDLENGLKEDFLILLAGLADDRHYLKERIAAMADLLAKCLMTLRGAGTITASALAWAHVNAKAFKCGRDIAASLGLTPRQVSTGSLLCISQRQVGRENGLHSSTISAIWVHHSASQQDAEKFVRQGRRHFDDGKITTRWKVATASSECLTDLGLESPPSPRP